MYSYGGLILALVNGELTIKKKFMKPSNGYFTFLVF